MNLLDLFSGKPTAAKWRALGDYLRAAKITGGVGVRIYRDPVMGTIISASPKKRSSQKSTNVCPFGEVITWSEGEGEAAETITGISGGAIQAGPETWNVDPFEINMESPGELLVWIAVNFTANVADGVLLGGIATASLDSVVWSTGTVAAGYPDQTIPVMETGGPTSGIAIIPIGVLTVIAADEGPPAVAASASLAPTGCGSFTVSHCPGSVTHSRI